jgi:hypothetical protein
MVRDSLFGVFVCLFFFWFVSSVVDPTIGVAYKSWMKRLYLSYFFSFDECRSYYNDGQCNNTLVRYLGKASRKYPGLNYDPTLDRVLWVDDVRFSHLIPLLAVYASLFSGLQSLINSMRPDGSGTKAVLGWPNLTGGLAYDSRKQILYFLAEVRSKLRHCSLAACNARF